MHIFLSLLSRLFLKNAARDSATVAPRSGPHVRAETFVEENRPAYTYQGAFCPARDFNTVLDRKEAFLFPSGAANSTPSTAAKKKPPPQAPPASFGFALPLSATPAAGGGRTISVTLL